MAQSQRSRPPIGGAQIIKALIARSGVAPEQISEIIMGQVLTAGIGQNGARQALIRAGIPDTVPANAKFPAY